MRCDSLYLLVECLFNIAYNLLLSFTALRLSDINKHEHVPSKFSASKELVLILILTFFKLCLQLRKSFCVRVIEFKKASVMEVIIVGTVGYQFKTFC